MDPEFRQYNDFSYKLLKIFRTQTFKYMAIIKFGLQNWFIQFKR